LGGSAGLTAQTQGQKLKAIEVGKRWVWTTRRFRRSSGTPFIGITQKIYIKSVSESQVSAMDVLEAKFSETSNNLPTGGNRLIN
jgi:hypothetical protein